MGALRERVLHDLVAADRDGRLRLVHPVASRARDCCVFVHSKVMIVDEQFLRIGSSNLSNRSLGLDTECDLAIEASGDPRIVAGIERVRARLLAEHLGVSAEAFRRELAARGSLIATVDALGAGDRGLCGIEVDPSPDAPLVPADLGVDPEGPLRVTRAIDRFLPDILRAERRSRGRFAVTVAVVTALVIGLGFLWRTPPFDVWLDPARLYELAQAVSRHPAAGLAVIGAFVAGALLSVPLNLLIVVTVLVFRGVAGGAYAFAGALAGALVTYAIGRWIGRSTLDALAGSVLGGLVQKLAGRGLVSVALLRIVPVAPATLVNLACGAVRIRLRDYLLGSAIGFLPGIVALSVLIRRPSLREAATVGAIALVLGLIVWRVRRTLAQHPAGEEAGPEEARFVHD
jgi:phospholipase D1/2